MVALTCVALFCILHYTLLNGICFSLECCGVEPKAEAVSLLELHFYTPLPVLLVLDPSVYQTGPTLISALHLFCHLHLSRNFTVSGLWYAYLGNILSVPVCRMDSCSSFQDYPARLLFVAVDLQCWLHIISS